MLIDVAAGTHPWRELYKLCISFIVPRPIALVSTLSAGGEPNLAPFSFYNMVCANPPIIMISVGTPRSKPSKDTLSNIRATSEFAIATVTAEIAPQMVRAAAELPAGENEFAFSGLTPAPAAKIRPALVGEAPINIECRLRQIVSLGAQPGGSHVIFGDIVAIHLRDDLLGRDGAVDARRLHAVGRLGGKAYADVRDPYELIIPAPPGGSTE